MNEGILKELAIRLGVIERTLRRAHTTPAGGGFKPDPGGSGMTPTGDIHLYGEDQIVVHDAANTVTVGTVGGESPISTLSIAGLSLQSVAAGNRAIELVAHNTSGGIDNAYILVRSSSGAGLQYVAIGTNSTEKFQVNTNGISTDGGTTNWTLGGYTAGAPTPTGYVTITIGGSTFKISVEAV